MCSQPTPTTGVFLGTFSFPAPSQMFPALQVKRLAELTCPGQKDMCMQQEWLLCYLVLDKYCHSRDIAGASKGTWAQLQCPIATAQSHRAIKEFYIFLNGERKKKQCDGEHPQFGFLMVWELLVRRKFGYHQLNFPVWLWMLGCKEPQTRSQDLPNF